MVWKLKFIKTKHLFAIGKASTSTLEMVSELHQVGENWSIKKNIKTKPSHKHCPKHKIPDLDSHTYMA